MFLLQTPQGDFKREGVLSLVMLLIIISIGEGMSIVLKMKYKKQALTGLGKQ